MSSMTVMYSLQRGGDRVLPLRAGVSQRTSCAPAGPGRRAQNWCAFESFHWHVSKLSLQKTECQQSCRLPRPAPDTSFEVPMESRPVSIKDVADRAGVAIGTVSNVLNHPARVSAATRERVQGAIDELGFVRNDAARQLRAGQSRTIGLIVLD